LIGLHYNILYCTCFVCSNSVKRQIPQNVHKQSAINILYIYRMSDITSEERLNLKRLINETECDDNTSTIRQLKHSVLIRDDIRRLDTLKKENATIRQLDPDSFMVMAQAQASFLYNRYTDLFNKIMKDELDLAIMSRVLAVLKMIEDEKVDQHEGSVLVGRILKELYLDSAIKRADNLDKEHEGSRKIPVESKKLSWSQYKRERKSSV
jgi:hypothetical protein